MPVATRYSEENSVSRSSRWGYGSDGSPPEAGPGGIKPAKSGSGGGRFAKLRHLSAADKGSGGGVSVQLMGRAMDGCHSPRAVRARALHMSPKAARMPLQSPAAFYAEQQSSHDAASGPPATPLGSSYTPGSIPVCHLASPLGVTVSRSPEEGNFDSASPPRDEFYAHSPVFFSNPEPNFGTPRSPGAFGRATRRNALRSTRASRFATPQAPGNAPISPGPSPGSPSDVYARRAHGKGTLQYLFPTDMPGSGDCLTPKSAERGRITPKSQQRMSRRHLLEQNGDDLEPTALLDTFEMGDIRGLPPAFTPGKFIMNTWSPQGSPSSVGSIPIEYDEEEYGYDRDIDYSQFEYLNDMMPAANFTVPKPADATRIRADSDSENEGEGGVTSSPTGSLRVAKMPKSNGRRGTPKTPSSGRRGIKLKSEFSPGSGQKSVGRRLFVGVNPMKTKSGRGPMKPGMRPRIGASRLGKVTPSVAAEESELTICKGDVLPQYHRYSTESLSVVNECSRQGEVDEVTSAMEVASQPTEDETPTQTRLFHEIPRRTYRQYPTQERQMRRCVSAQAPSDRLPAIDGHKLGMQDRSTYLPHRPSAPRSVQSFNPRTRLRIQMEAERDGLAVVGKSMKGIDATRKFGRQLSVDALCDGRLPAVKGATRESPSTLTQENGFGPQVSAIPRLPVLHQR